MRTFLLDWTIERGLETYDVLVEYRVTSWGCAAQISGPPEDCYPAEGPEFEIERVVVTPPAWAAHHHPSGIAPFAITDAEASAIYEELWRHPPEPDGPDPDDWYDSRHEREEFAREYD